MEFSLLTSQEGRAIPKLVAEILKELITICNISINTVIINIFFPELCLHGHVLYQHGEAYMANDQAPVAQRVDSI